MLFNKTPFWGKTEFQIMEDIRLGEVKLPGDDVRKISEEIKEVLLSLLTKSFKERITLSELTKNQWLMKK